MDKYMMCKEQVAAINIQHIQTCYIDYSGYEQKYYLWATLSNGEHVKIKEVPEMSIEEQRKCLMDFILNNL